MSDHFLDGWDTGCNYALFHLIYMSDVINILIHYIIIIIMDDDDYDIDEDDKLW